MSKNPNLCFDLLLCPIALANTATIQQMKFLRILDILTLLPVNESLWFVK